MVKRLRTDQDYIDAGVEPPEHITHHGSDTSIPDTHTHSWVQQANYLHCDAGQNGHGMPFDHVNKILAGTSPEGAPLLKDIQILDIIVVKGKNNK